MILLNHKMLVLICPVAKQFVCSFEANYFNSISVKVTLDIPTSSITVFNF